MILTIALGIILAYVLAFVGSLGALLLWGVCVACCTAVKELANGPNKMG